MNIDKSRNVREFIGIEYPGRVQNVNNMIETLGGDNEISRAFDEKQKLQLKLNPKNLYCKSAISTEQEEVTGMLLKLRIKKIKDNPEKKVEYLSAELVGTVKSMYKFNNFSDYQYLPLQKNDKTGKTENIYHDIVPENPQDGPMWFR
jgi:general transcription factor 3C polypeptide 5 (transcription factor C subunit 1)